MTVMTQTANANDVDFGFMEQIDAVELNDRLENLKERYINTMPQLASERGTYYAESWSETEGQPIQIRCAKAVKKVLENVPTPIFENELVVGSVSRFFRGSYTMITYDSNWVLELLEQCKEGEISMGGVNVIGKLEEKDEKALRENSAFFKGKTNKELEDEVTRTIWGSWHDDVVRTERAGAVPLRAAGIRHHLLR